MSTAGEPNPTLGESGIPGETGVPGVTGEDGKDGKVGFLLIPIPGAPGVGEDGKLHPLPIPALVIGGKEDEVVLPACEDALLDVLPAHSEEMGDVDEE